MSKPSNTYRRLGHAEEQARALEQSKRILDDLSSIILKAAGMNDAEFQTVIAAAWDRVPPSINVWESLTVEQRAEIMNIFEARGAALPIDWPVKIGRSCAACRYWLFTPPDYDVIMETGCAKGHWDAGMIYNLGVGTFAAKLLTARTCGDFTLSRVALESMPEGEK